MPSRIIKESICASDSMAALNWFEQTMFVRLIVLADDYGIFDARPAIIIGRGFPLSNVTEKQIMDGLKHMAEQNMITLYTCKGRPYLKLNAWDNSQRIRAMKSKYPLPTDADSCTQLTDNCQTIDGQLLTNVAVIQSNPNPIRIQSESESNPMRKSDIDEIVDYLNKKAGTSYKASTEATKKHINARLNEGFTVEQFKQVIDSKCSQWLYDNKMKEYLRPETLFGTKFEAYLNKPTTNNKSLYNNDVLFDGL